MSRKRETLILLALVGLSAVVQSVMIRRAVVPAQDAVRFAAAAQAFVRNGIGRSLAEAPEPPLFPMLASGTHYVLDKVHRALAGNETQTISWATKLQVAAALPVVLCVVPVYLLARRWLGVPVAVTAGALFAVLKEPARLGADGISDSTHLLLVAVAIWAAASFLCAVGEARRTRRGDSDLNDNTLHEQPDRRLVWLAICGAAVGMALLVRPESLLLLPALVALLPAVAVQRWPPRRRWRGAALSVVLLLFGLSAVLLPYAYGVGVDDLGQLAQRLSGRSAPRDGVTLNDSNQKPAVSTLSKTVTAESAPTFSDGTRMRFVLKETTVSSRFSGLPAAAAEYARELAAVFQYWLVPLALLAVWRARRDWRRPMNRFALMLFVLLSAVVIFHASRVGYLAGRHLLILLLLGIPWAGQGMVEVSRWLQIRLATTGARRASGGRSVGRFVLPSIVTAVAVLCLISTLRPLHASRMAHRQAAEWLTQPAQVAGAVLDSRGWTGLYTSRATYLCDAGWQAVADPRLAYVVLEEWEIELASRRSRTLRHLVQSRGRRVAEFGDHRDTGAARVVVYQVQSPSVAFRSNDVEPASARSFPVRTRWP